MPEDLDAILARAQRAIEQMERLSAMAERLSNEARKVLVSLEPPASSPPEKTRRGFLRGMDTTIKREDDRL